MSDLVLLGLPSFSAIIDSIGVYLAALLYKGVALVFKVFLILANGKLVDSDQYTTLITNFYVIIGIVMLFTLAFALLRGMINPDDKKQGTETVKKVILNLVTSSLIMAVLPTIFAFAFDFQNSVLIRQNTIGRFFGYGGTAGVDLAIDQGANQMANGVFTAFFNVNQQACDEGDSITDCQKKVKDNDDDKTFYEVMEEVDATGQFGLYSSFSEKIGNDNEIDHNWIFNIIAGGFMAYVAISFCFDMAIRMIKLIFYQLIAPVPVFLRVVPNGKLSGTFNQWLKVTVTCYLEVFIRILIFYFCIYLFNSLFGSNGYGANMSFLNGTAYGVGLYVKAFIIMGIIMFMKQAPKLISEITGIDSGNMKLGIKDKLKDGGFFSVVNAAGGLVTGGIPGAVRGFRYGSKNADFRHMGQEAAKRREFRDALEAGATRFQIYKDRLRQSFGFDSSYDAEERKIEKEEELITNQTGKNIEYVNSKGEKVVIGTDGKVTINGNLVTNRADGKFEVNQMTIEDMEAQKAENVRAMGDYNEQLRMKDKLIKFGGAQIQFKSNIKGEAEKKIDEPGSKQKGHITYDAIEEVLDEKTGKMVKKTVQKDFEGTFAQIQEFINKDLDPEQRQKYNLNAIRDEMIKEFVRKELHSADDNKTKQDMVAGFTSIMNNGGYSYKYRDSSGNILDGRIDVEQNQDGSFKVKQTRTNADGTSTEVILSDLYHDQYDIVDAIDKIAKSSNGILNLEKQNIDETLIDPLRTANENLDNIVKTAKEAKEARKKAPEQRKRELSKKYTAKSNKN